MISMMVRANYSLNKVILRDILTREEEVDKECNILTMGMFIQENIALINFIEEESMSGIILLAMLVNLLTALWKDKVFGLKRMVIAMRVSIIEIRSMALEIIHAKMETNFNVYLKKGS